MSEVASVLFHGKIIVEVHVTVSHGVAQPILRAHSGGLWSFVLHEVLQVKETTVEKKTIWTQLNGKMHFWRSQTVHHLKRADLLLYKHINKKTPALCYFLAAITTQKKFLNYSCGIKHTSSILGAASGPYKHLTNLPGYQKTWALLATHLKTK